MGSDFVQHSAPARPSGFLSDGRGSKRCLDGDAIFQDSQLGPEIAATLLRLRQRRNAVAHEPYQQVSVDGAGSYAKRAFELISIFGKLDRKGLS